MLTVTRNRSRRSRPIGCSRDRRGRAGVHVRRRAHLERHASIAHERRETSEHRPTVWILGDVVDDAHAVAESFGATPLQRLPDRRQAERLAGVDRDVEVLARHELERVEMTGGREAGLGSRDVEADDAIVTPPHRELGDLTRPRLSAHGREQRVHRDRMTCGGRTLGSDREAVDHRADDIVEPELSLGVQLGGEPDLGVHDAVGRQVLGALSRDPHQRLARLHHRKRVVETLEVQHQVLLVRTRHEPLRELADILRRQTGVAARIRELDHGRGAHPAVEVIVQQRLGRPHEGVERRAAHANPRSGMSTPRCNQFSSG